MVCVSALWCLSQHLPSYLGFSYLGRGVSLHGYSRRVQPLLLTLDEVNLLTATPPDFECGVAPLSSPASTQPLLLGCGVASLGRRPDLRHGVAPFRGTRDQIANICWIMEKGREFQKNIYFCFIDYAKAFPVWITINSGKFWKRWEYQTTWLASWETYMQVRKQQLELDMEQQSGSK